MSMESWPAYFVYGLGYTLAAAFLIAYRREVAGKPSHRAPKNFKNAEAA